MQLHVDIVLEIFTFSDKYFGKLFSYSFIRVEFRIFSNINTVNAFLNKYLITFYYKYNVRFGNLYIVHTKTVSTFSSAQNILEKYNMQLYVDIDSGIFIFSDEYFGKLFSCGFIRVELGYFQRLSLSMHP